MKAKQHLAFNGVLLFFLLIIIIFIGKFDIFNFLFNNNKFLVIIIGVGFYFLGSILPDADSEDKRSYIYHKPFLVPIAYTVNLLEYPLLKITKRNRGHRKSLHTITGIFLSSFVVTILFSILYYWLIKINFSILSMIIWFLCLFIGQFFHLVGDKLIEPHWKINWI